MIQYTLTNNKDRYRQSDRQKEGKEDRQRLTYKKERNKDIQKCIQIEGKKTLEKKRTGGYKDIGRTYQRKIYTRIQIEGKKTLEKNRTGGYKDIERTYQGKMHIDRRKENTGKEEDRRI